ncbi:cation transporter [Pseudohalocynthiibacter aestuariivivens]|nr:cation transporter [Pseudohalocynthiibacter aestuariivivens]
MDCASCAAKIEKAVRSAGIDNPKISVASQVLTLEVDQADRRLSSVEAAVSNAGYHLVRLEDSDNGAGTIQTHTSADYRQALYIVVGLNIGYGIIEMIGGVFSGSQALKADALDFLGDGLITFLGLLAIGWRLIWRARSALIQGLFLGALGIGVIINTIYRMATNLPVNAELMGGIALIALAVNIAAALILVPHRTGDANVRAVWLFSRNDAIGNIAVVAAAGLVSWTGTPLPDRIVAFIIAFLFLHSSWIIVRDARNDMHIS